MSKSKVAKLKAVASSLEKDATTAKSPATSMRMRALAGVLKNLSPLA
jgi:hypothetical protein